MDLRMEKIEIIDDHTPKGLCYRSFELDLKLRNHRVEIIYISEPPHGDSYHTMRIDDREIPGYVWGNLFLFPYNQEYVVCSWMERLYDRKTIIVDIPGRRYHIMQSYWGTYCLQDERLVFSDHKKTKELVIDIRDIDTWINY